MQHSPLARRAARLALAAMAAWSAAGFGAEAYRALALYAVRDRDTPPMEWRFGMAPTARFSRCILGVRPSIPAGSTVAFASLDGPRGAAFFRWRWAAYLLPDLDLKRWGDPAAGVPPGFVLTYRLPLTQPRLVLVAQQAGARLYRIAR